MTTNALFSSLEFTVNTISLFLLSALLLVSHSRDLVAQKTPFAIARDSVKPLILKGADGEPLFQEHFAGAAMLSNGSVAYADRYEHRIVLFDSLGKLIATVGKKGAGPGEFEHRSHIMRFNGDSIAVFDGTLRRISIFDSRLKFVRTQPVLSAPAPRGATSVEGQFSDGSVVSVVSPFAAMDAPSGVHTFQRTLVVAEPGGKFRQFPLPTFPELIHVAGNTTTRMRVPFSSVQAVAVCERGFVVIADSVVKVYDPSFRLLFTPPYRGHVNRLTSSDRAQAIGMQASSRNENKWHAAVDAANPKQMVQYFIPTVSADGMIWYNLAGPHAGRFVRTTPRGDVIDTVLAPFQLYHANRRTGVAAGPRETAEDDAPTVLLRQPGKDRKADPASPLGRCNAARDY